MVLDVPDIAQLVERLTVDQLVVCSIHTVRRWSNIKFERILNSQTTYGEGWEGEGRRGMGRRGMKWGNSGVAQRKRVWLITKRSVVRIHSPLLMTICPRGLRGPT